MFAGGLVLLAVGVGVAVVRNNRDVDRREARAEAQRAHYDVVLARVAKAPPRFKVSYVRATLAAVRRLAHNGYTMVDTEVTRRIETGRPSLRPDFAAMAGTATDGTSIAFREHGVEDETLHVVALLVTQTTPGEVARLRLDVKRLSLRTYASVWDPLDLLTVKDSMSSIFRSATLGTKGKGVVEWKPRLGRTAIVPLSLLHLFHVPDTPENKAVVDALEGSTGVQVATGVVLAPKRLVIERKRGRDVEVVLDRALHPLVLAAGAG